MHVGWRYTQDPALQAGVPIKTVNQIVGAIGASAYDQHRQVSAILLQRQEVSAVESFVVLAALNRAHRHDERASDPQCVKNRGVIIRGGLFTDDIGAKLDGSSIWRRPVLLLLQRHHVPLRCFSPKKKEVGVLGHPREVLHELFAVMRGVEMLGLLKHHDDVVDKVGDPNIGARVFQDFEIAFFLAVDPSE